jgi:hypothetical protein
VKLFVRYFFKFSRSPLYARTFKWTLRTDSLLKTIKNYLSNLILTQDCCLCVYTYSFYFYFGVKEEQLVNDIKKEEEEEEINNISS